MGFGSRRGTIRSVAQLPQIDPNWVAVANGLSTYATPKFGANVTISGGEANSKITTLVSALGIKSWRGAAVQWSQIEETLGNYTTTNSRIVTTDNFIAATSGSAEMVQNFWAFSNSLYPGTQFGNDVPGACPNYVAAVAAMASHWGSSVNKYEIVNADNPANDKILNLNALYNSRTAIKSVNLSADVFGVAIDDPNPSISNRLNDYLNAVMANGMTWKDVSDGYSFHIYRGMPNGAAHTPENLWGLSRLVISTVQAARPNCRIWITESSWPNSGGTAITQALAADYVSRFMFMLRCHPGLEIFHYYLDYDDSFGQGLYTSGGSIKTQGAVMGACLPIVHASSAGKFYQHASDNVLAVGLQMNDGTRRVVLWGQTWKSSTGANDGTDQSTTAHLTFDAWSTGTLAVQTLGGSTDTSTSLSLGANTLSIPVTGRAVVLSATCPGSFRGLSPS